MSNNHILQEELLRFSMIDFVERHHEVTFLYEFDERRNCFLISYNVPSFLYEDVKIWDALYEFKSKIRDEFGEDAPIFMEGESICMLSSKAKKIQIEECASLSEDMLKGEECILSSSDSFVSENFPNYSFALDGNEVCFFDGYSEYLKAA